MGERHCSCVANSRVRLRQGVDVKVDVELVVEDASDDDGAGSVGVEASDAGRVMSLDDAEVGEDGPVSCVGTDVGAPRTDPDVELVASGIGVGALSVSEAGVVSVVGGSMVGAAAPVTGSVGKPETMRSGQAVVDVASV